MCIPHIYTYTILYVNIFIFDMYMVISQDICDYVSEI